MSSRDMHGIYRFFKFRQDSVVSFPIFPIKLKAPDCCAQLFDRERSLITDKHTEVLDCISYVMVFLLSTRHAEPIYRPLQGQGRPSCQKSRSKVKRFKQESAHNQPTHELEPYFFIYRVIPSHSSQFEGSSCADQPRFG